MISSAIKKFAQQNSLTCDHGVAYGDYQGYLLTMRDGSGVKYANFAIHFTEENQRQMLCGFLSNKDFQKTYRLKACEVSDRSLELAFADTVGTMPKIIEFLGIVIHQLQELGVAGAAVCPHCGLALQPGQEKHILLDGTVYGMHPGCITQLHTNADEQRAELKKNGNVMTGTLGAILGGVIGSIPWALAYYFGWFVAWLGLVIGLAAKKGYELGHGKETKVKAVVVTLVSVICVVLTQYVTLSVVLTTELVELNLTFLETMQLLLGVLLTNAEAMAEFARDVLLGWLFVALGIFPAMKQIFSDTNRRTAAPIELD